MIARLPSGSLPPPRWAPDDQSIAYQRGCRLHPRHLAVSANGGEPQRISREGRMLSGFTWTAATAHRTAPRARARSSICQRSICGRRGVTVAGFGSSRSVRLRHLRTSMPRAARGEPSHDEFEHLEVSCGRRRTRERQSRRADHAPDGFQQTPSVGASDVVVYLSTAAVTETLGRRHDNRGEPSDHLRAGS